MRISEDFYSVQGEGISQGMPAYFVRLQGCNLMCGGMQGRLVKEGKANWWCDTEDVWRQGVERNNEYLINRFQEHKQLENILDGLTRIVWTGGEPTSSYNRNSIKEFIDFSKQVFEGNSIYSEIETNGTNIVEENFYGKYIQQINCSPKLRNSGMEKERRIILDAIKQINQYNNSWFKFVVSNEEDIKEIENDYLDPFSIDSDRVIIMPACDDLQSLCEKTKMCYELTKKYGYRTIPRGHILAWNKTTGV